MVDIIHHSEESANGGLSPFDTAIRDIASDEDASIACPYITLDYLESMLQDTESWRLLTDTEAWLDNYATDQRKTIRKFIARNHDRIHDIRNLHAKAVIGDTSALVGSANLTRMGVGKRDELAVRLDEPDRIVELREWFDGLWEDSSLANLNDIDDRIRTSSPVPSSGGGGTSIPSSARRVSASIAEDNARKPNGAVAGADSNDAHERLVERVGKAPSRKWIESHFDLFEELLAVSGLSTDNSILVASIPKTGGVHITVNNRYVLTMMRTAQNRPEFIISNEADDLDTYISEATEHYPFSNRNSEPAPHLLTFENGLEQITDPSFKRGWFEAVLSEVENRDERAKWRDNHEPTVYEVAVDHEYREDVLDEAFRA